MGDKKMEVTDIIEIFNGRRAEPILKLRYFAILALLTEKNGELCFVLNKRSNDIHQPGDICFPGGHRERDEGLRETALRETEEELGIPKDSILILGRSDYMLTIYRGLIQPFIGFVPYDTLRSSCPNKEEVAEIFTVPLSFFWKTSPEIHSLTWEVLPSPTFPYHRIEGGQDYPFSKTRIPELFYEYKGHTIWGFTAQVIQNIAEIIEKGKKIIPEA